MNGAAYRTTRAWAAVRCAAAILLVLFVSLLPEKWAWWLLAPAGVLLAGILFFKVKILGRKGLLRRVIFLEPFVMGVALLALFSPGGGWAMFGFLMARCTLALLAMILFTATTPFSDMLWIFSRCLRVPPLLVTTLALMHRYLFVLAEEAGRMRRARQSRTFTRRRGATWRAMSTVIGQLFLRASERADRIYDAMCARGWEEGPR